MTRILLALIVIVALAGAWALHALRATQPAAVEVVAPVNAEFEAFKAQVLKAADAPADLRILFDMQQTRALRTQTQTDPLQDMEVNLLQPGQRPFLLDEIYQTGKDNTDPEYMANVAATRKVLAYITFVAEGRDSNLYGYWHGPQNLPLRAAPIVKYDNEGQFNLLPGVTLTEALVGDDAFDDQQRFGELKKMFEAWGIQFAAKRWDDLAFSPVTPRPEDLDKTYTNEERAARGLKPVQ